ncbi:MAG TPA: hypothetical protein VNI01_16215, partial [Elusimicrobiota bacterium]|nr:hypothetical protein [Elusimicrobiota bacterium]
PAFHDTPNTTSGGVYSLGLALIYSYPDDAHGRFKRLLTIAHESYHQFADEKGIPVRENDRWPQERGAHLVELLFARHVRDNPELGIAFPRDTRLARPLELLDQGRVVPVLEEVDRRYDEYQRTGSLTAVEPDHYGGMLDRLTAELRASYTQLSALRRSGGGAQDETARQALERRLLALRRYWNANFSVFFGYLF